MLDALVAESRGRNLFFSTEIDRGIREAEALREALLAQVTVDRLQCEGQNAYGERYQAVVVLTGRLWASEWSGGADGLVPVRFRR